jgi:YD repeat-containing protein
MSSMNLEQDSTDKLTVGYTYDAMSRIVTVSDGTNTAEYTRLTGTNLLNTVTVKQGATAIVNTTKDYDAFNRLLLTSSVTGATARAYSYVYNDKDQRTKLTLPDGSCCEYTYDDKGQVTSGVKKD